MEIEVQEASVATAQLSFQVDPLMLFSHRLASQKDLEFVEMNTTHSTIGRESSDG